MDELLKKILEQDKTLLNRKDELISILDEKVPSRLARDYNSVKRALNLNIGEIFATGNGNREAAIAKATEILTQSGLQEARVKNVIDTFVKALSWDKEPVYEEPFTEEEEEEIAPSQETEFSSQSTIETQSVKNTDSQSPKVKIPPSPQNDNPPPAQPPQQPQYQSPPPANNNGLKAIIVVLAVALFFSLSGDDNKNSSKEKQSSYAQEETQVEKSTEVQPDLKVVEKPPTPEPYLSAKSDLSLNGMDLGIQLDQITSNWGQPNSVKNDSNRKRYYYDDIEVVFNNDYVTAFVTYHSKYKTAKGLHVGSTYDEVVSKYGSAPHIMQMDDLILYEYDYNTIRGEKSLLRFAVNKSDSRVNYVSMRVLEPSNNSNSNSNQSNEIPENVRQAAMAFLSYHENITEKNFRRAYDLQTYSRKQTMGDIDTFKKGYSNTLKSEITDLNLIANNGDSVTLAYVLEASDKDNGGTIYRTFKGEVEMVKDSGAWKINSVRSKKISENRR